MDTDLLAKIPLFSKLNSSELGELAGLMKEQQVAHQQPVFWIGDEGTDFFIIREGRVAVSYPDETGHHVTIAVLAEGDFFGEISLLDGGPRTATVRAEDDSQLLALSRQDFLDFLKRNPPASVHVLTVLGQRQREMLQKMRGLKNVNEAIEERTTAWQRISDMIATVSASQWFVLMHVIWFGAWMVYNVVTKDPPDPYPYGLLTMIVSLEAIFLSIFVLVSQNRAGEKDRIRADLDYQVNLKAHLEVMQLHRKIDRIEHAVNTLAGVPGEESAAPSSVTEQMLGVGVKVDPARRGTDQV
jgi:uncharacterized membrane protein